MIKWLHAAIFVFAAGPVLASESYPVPGVSLGDAKAVDAFVPRLAGQLLSDRPDANADDRFRLLMAAGRNADAAKALNALLQSRASSPSPQVRSNDVQYAILLQAENKAGASTGAPLALAYAEAFRDRFARLDDRASAMLIRAMHTDYPSLHSGFEARVAGIKGVSNLDWDAAMSLVRGYQIDRAYAAMQPLMDAPIAADDARRYIVDENIRIPTPDGGTVCAMVYRQRSAPSKMPALLNYTIYNDRTDLSNEARRSASNGYAGVIGLVRGKGCSPDKPVPYEHDGADAATTINWIASQPWSDGQVGMYGGSYEGFTQWAAAKHMPPALKAMMPSVSANPGIDVPMEGNVGWTFNYNWIFYTTNNKTLDDATYNDSARWDGMLKKWYTTGVAFRSLDKIDGTPNPIFDRWLDHPSYDAYWKAMTPQGAEFAKITIPVLTTTGYYDGGEVSALYYFTQHHEHLPGAEHYLLIAPYDHVRGQRGTVGALGNDRNVVMGYTLDPVARIDLGELRYQWFDYTLKHGVKPALLKDTVNYEVMGGNEWKHAPSIAAMAGKRVRYYLGSGSAGALHSLELVKPSSSASSTELSVDLADRSDVDRQSPASGDIIDRKLDTYNGVAFVSEPFAQATEVSGLFSGGLDFTVNKKDFDFTVDLYELMGAGEYVHLSNYLARASYVADRGKRALLVPGKAQHLDIAAGRMISRLMAKGSRLVVLVAVPKGTGTQINYGTGKLVSDETVADGEVPLRIVFGATSFIEVPLATVP